MNIFKIFRKKHKAPAWMDDMVFDFKDDAPVNTQPEEYIDDEFSREGARLIAEINAMVPGRRYA